MASKPSIQGQINELPDVLAKIAIHSLADSTYKNYNSYFEKYLQYLQGRDIHLRDTNETHVMEFMEGYVRRGVSVSTIKAIWAALRFGYMCNELHIMDSWRIAAFYKGAQRLCTHPRSLRFTWDLGVSLQKLSDIPVPVEKLALAREAVFLFLSATGLRIDDIWKLSGQCLVQSGIYFFPYLAARKCNPRGGSASGIHLRPYHLDRLCPIGAVFRYWSAIGKDHPLHLFPSVTSERATKETLRHWVSEAFRLLGIEGAAGSTRAASNSWGMLHTNDINYIMNRGGWYSENTFSIYYNRPILPSAALYSLPLPLDK